MAINIEEVEERTEVIALNSFLALHSTQELECAEKKIYGEIDESIFIEKNTLIIFSGDNAISG